MDHIHMLFTLLIFHSAADLLLCNIFHGKAHPAHSVFAKTYHGYLVTQGKDIFYTVNSSFGNLGNMHHTFFTRSKFHKCAKLLNAYHNSLEDLPLLIVRNDGLRL